MHHIQLLANIKLFKIQKIIVLFLILLRLTSYSQSTDYKFSIDIENDTNQQYGYQMKTWELSRINNYQKALLLWDKDRNDKLPPSRKDSVLFSKLRPLNAYDYILSQADSFQIIMLNEAHHNNLHRQFTKSLLKELYDKGFTFFGLEAVSQMDSTLNERKYPTQSSGFYTKTPPFGNLIRTALEIGFTVFGYECSTKNNSKQREIEQAENIKKILDKNPNAKIIIHAGFDHIREDEGFGSWEKAMAGRLKEFTGIDPLTIDQVQMSERSSKTLENPLYRLASVTEPTVFLTDSNMVYVDPHSGKKFDIQVFHPRTIYYHNRENWLFSENNFYYPLKIDSNEFSYPCLVFAFKKNEFVSEKLNELLPVDIIEIDQFNKSDIGLLLEKGKYSIIYKDRTGKIDNNEIEIK